METFSWNKSTWIASIMFRGGHHAESGWLEPVLKTGVKLAAAGYPVPWLGLLGDLWNLIGSEDSLTRQSYMHPELASHPTFLDYQDVVLARFHQDAGFCRIRRALSGRPVDRKIDALIFILESWTDLGVCLGIPVPTGLMVSLAADCCRLAESSREMIEKEGWPHELINLVKSFTSGFRNLSFVLNLGVAGVIEKGLDIAERAPRIQLRQIASAQADLDELISKRTLRQTETFRHVLSTEIGNGLVPLGGYSSISTRGRLESLLPSQIAWLNLPVGEANYFQVKYQRQELLYYSRSENRLFKSSRNIIFMIDKSLKGSRTKNPKLPFQSMTLLLATFLCLWEQLKKRLSFEGLTLTFMFVDCGQEFSGEKKLLKMLLGSEIHEGRVQMVDFDDNLIINWVSQVIRDPGTSKVLQFIGESPIHQYFGETCSIPCIMLKGSDLILLDGWTSEQKDTPVWPECWAETISYLIEILAIRE